jgi:uncharacterized membrane protein YphA (DoxX/SURF4 family)
MKLHPNLGLLLVRLALGAMFLHAGLMKFLVFGYSNFIAKSSAAIPSYLPQPLGKAYLYVVPFAETIIGITLIIGLLTRISALITALMLLSFMMAATGFIENKGPHSSLLFMFVALGLALTGPGRYSVDAIWPRKRRAE